MRVMPEREILTALGAVKVPACPRGTIAPQAV